jgi:hypothetical protein
MPKECAFCPATDKFSGEHIWSKWMRKLFKSKKFRFSQRNSAGKVIRQWAMPGIDMKARVVCKKCNEGWMSKLESEHAEPAMSDLILAKDVLISESRAKSIAVFAFKTAVVVDHMGRDKPFYTTTARREFAHSLTIPRNVNIWLAGLFPMSSGRCNSLYPEIYFEAPRYLKLNVCTFAVGHLVFQVVGAQYIEIPDFGPKPGFEHLAVPIWPPIQQDIGWPLPNVLKYRSDFESFSNRWSAIRLVK